MNGISAWVTSSSNAEVMSCIAFSISGEPKGLAGEIGSGLAGAAGVAICHHDDHRLAVFSGNQIVEDEVCMCLPNPSRLDLASAMLEIENRIANLGWSFNSNLQSARAVSLRIFGSPDMSRQVGSGWHPVRSTASQR